MAHLTTRERWGRLCEAVVLIIETLAVMAWVFPFDMTSRTIEETPNGESIH